MKKYSILCLVMISLLFFPPVVFAATEEDVPTGDGSPTAWTNGFAAVDETVAAANDVDFIVSSTAGQIELFTFSHTVPAASTAISVQQNFRCHRKIGGAAATYTLAPEIEVSNTASTGTNIDMNLVTAFTNLTETYSTCPVATCTNGAGGAWDKVDLDNLEFGVNTIAIGSKDFECSQLSLTITFTPPAGVRRIILVD